MQTLFTLFPYIAVLVVIGAGYVIQMLPARQKAELEALNQKTETVRSVIYDVVHKIEQTMPDAFGSSKKSAAINAVNAILAELKIPISAGLVDAMIESIVSELPHTSSQTQPAPSASGAHPFTAN